MYLNQYSTDLEKASTQYFDRTNGGVFDLATGTIECWVMLESNGFDQCICSTNKAVGSTGFKFAVNASNQIQLDFTNGGGTGDKSVNSTATLSTATKYHVAVTWDGTDAKLYINGVLDTTSSSWGALQTPGDTFTVGKEVRTGDRYFDGRMDDLRIWNVRRTAPQLLANMSAVIAAQTGLIAYYQFENNPNDSSGNSYTLTAFNTPTYSSTNLFPSLLDGSDTGAGAMVITEKSATFASSQAITGGTETMAITDGRVEIVSAWTNLTKPSSTGWTNLDK